MGKDFDLFVIGGGSAGVRLARISAGHGARVGIAEAKYWGGTCVNVGCIPKKLLVMAADYGFSIADAGGFGWDVPPRQHDWARMIAAKDREISRLNGVYERLLEQAGVRMFEARAKFIDAHTLDVGGQRITAERIAIATGGQPTRLDIPGAEHAIVSDDAFFLPERPRRIAIFGGGYIGVEFAGMFQGLGSQVHMVYRQPLPLRGFDLDLRVTLAETLAGDGIRLHPETLPTGIMRHGGTLQVDLSDDTAIEVDCAFFATGRAPNLHGLGLDAAGVRTEAKGAIPVDDCWQTNIPHIHAIGDVTDRLNLTPVATAEGHALADALFGGKRRKVSLEGVPTAVFSIPPMATVGMTEEAAAARGETKVFVTRFTPQRHNLTGRPRKTLMKLVVDARTDRVLGAHMLGEDAPEIVQGIAIAMTAGATKADFDRTIGIHPTAAEEFVTMRSETRRAGAAKAAE
ncbi:MAG TPA: glutathione-disulfide reductase [Acetobacteraceae bacterium]|nr:glutathione-disulfide reductase [Acetobacteraceae bacterium]